MSLRCAREPANLLNRLYGLAHRQQENFVTESFTHLLHHLCHAHPAIGSRVIEWLAGEGFLHQRTSDSPIRIRTQLATDEFGIPDIRVEAEDLDLIIEVKLGGGITFGQLDDYRQELESAGRDRRALVALLGYRSTADLPEATRVRTWGELALFLSDQADQAGSEVTSELVRQFVGLLNRLGLTPLQVRSTLSAGIRRHREWADANPGLPALTRGRVRSTSTLQGMVGCEPLLNLLLQLQHVLDHAEGVRVYRLDSGPSGRKPWIGFNVNDQDFFWFLWLDSPEVLHVQTYGVDVDPDLFDRSLGEIEPRSRGRFRWRDSLDLLDPDVDYFSRDRAEQVGILGAFFERAFRFGRGLRSTPAAGEEERVRSLPETRDEEGENGR